MNEPTALLVGLIADISAAAPGVRVVVVDDSLAPHADEFAAGLNEAVPAVAVLSRREDRAGGLAGAVLAGMRHARAHGATYALVMDADGQHPPAQVPQLLAALARGEGHDLVVASRYRSGGSVGTGLGLSRKAVSRLFGAAAHTLFPVALRGCTDPMSGFFGVRLAAVNLDSWADGFKILLQLLAQHPRLRRTEVPFEFLERRDGTSKAGLVEGLRYLRGLVSLRTRVTFASAPKPHRVPPVGPVLDLTIIDPGHIAQESTRPAVAMAELTR